MKIAVVSSNELSQKDLRPSTFVSRPPIDQEVLERFRPVYKECLAEAHKRRMFRWPIEQLDAVVEKVMQSIRQGTYEQNGPAMRAACRKIGIKSTRKAIEAHFRPTPL